MTSRLRWALLGALGWVLLLACDDPGLSGEGLPTVPDAALCVEGMVCDTGGEGACGPGRTACVDGVERCVAEAESTGEICDALDNDCDGEVDEGYGVGAPCVGEGQCAGTGLYACMDGDVVCEVDTPAVGDAELCNGLDDDCDGQIDEAFLTLGEPCQGGSGRCTFDGAYQCAADGADVVCAGVPMVAEMERCNGEDEDCDGRVDEGPDGGALTTPCYDGPEGTAGVGSCAEGVAVCINGAFGACEGWRGPNFEVCNENDDDCDGATDEGRDGGALVVTCYDGPQGTAGVGRCRPGSAECVAGRPADCIGQVIPSVELCDLVDDDCDGVVDESETDECQCEAGQERDCFGADPALEGVGQCVAGIQTCGENGLWTRCRDAVLPLPEQCDGEDDDCDGLVDEDIAGLGAECNFGVGGCRRAGVFRCVFGQGLRCDVQAGAPELERCDTIDNDCDGETDEDFPVGAECIGGLGACASPGRLRCDAAGELRCEAELPAPVDEACDGVDNDCDGETDEDFGLGDACQVGFGACGRLGTFVCGDDGQSYCDAEPGEPVAEVCDGIDNDCDDRLDEDFAVGGPCSDGVGACFNEGVIGCNDAGELACTVVAGLPEQDVCNGIDDDCDGAVDENIRPRGICDTGMLGRCQSGTFACVEGAERCVATQEGIPEVCDNLDNDCDLIIDEELGTLDCGLGVCARELSTCTQGEPTRCDPFAGASVRELCNGLDDDCDGDLDELAFGDGAPCGAGIGACQREGIGRCENGALLCDAVPGEPTPEVCNGIDDDCDGTTDEDAIEPGARCTVGVGECRVSGRPQCDDGQRICPLVTGDPVLEMCNGLDDDCDGDLDEGFGSVVCGLGICRHAVQNCDGGEAPVCDPLEGQQDEVCNGLDDDCDGNTDELLPGVGEACIVGVGQCRTEGITACGDQGIVCGARPGPPIEERCNGLDDDCDGSVDEAPIDAGRPCAVGQGNCRVPATLACVDAELVCDGVPAPAILEICNGEDDDCDGAADESLGDFVCGQGVCARTLPVCVNGEQTGCNPFLGAEDESCNGLDDDCDGIVDEQIPVGDACRAGRSRCRVDGIERCIDGVFACDAEPLEPEVEVCNQIDDDCDIRIDEDLGVREPCTVGEGLCRAFGRTVCGEAGDVVCNATPFEPEEETCNLLDDDCDGEVDEGLDQAGACQTGRPGLCNAGRISCVDGVRQCVGRFEPADEVCNGLDEDCDGAIDEALGTQDCGLGICARELPVCERGRPVDCFATAGARAEVCNDLDDDCDGTTDEATDIDGAECVIGLGECAVVGVGRCADGEALCDGQTGEPVEERCNQLDDDCDGQTDEETVESATPCFVGLGECEERALFECVAGEAICPVEAGEPVPEVCDRLDNDCDGVGDEDFGEQVCGVGRCQHVLVECLPEAGEVVCNPLEGALPEECNDIDDDCDGITDEEIVGVDNPCRVGRGECAAEGVLFCFDRAVVCDAVPGDPSPEICDGLDNDCDGAFDEDPTDLPEACQLGVGVCARAGEPVCRFGRILCDGQPAAAREELCNAIDDDCDGEVDEELGTIECGLGICRHEVPSCVDGAPGVCDPAEGLAPEVCNGADDDCDGDIDENQGFLLCGLGICRTQALRCVGGQINECVPEVGLDEEICDGRDNDCDGSVDEEAGQVGTPCTRGEGVCRRQGVHFCGDGELQCDAEPGDPQPELCNLRDDDCDGVVDEDLAEAEQTCRRGIGACLNEVPIICVRGRFECPAVAGVPVAEVCDKQDNDCDGLIDEQEDNPDCNRNGVDDRCDLEFGVPDCNNNNVIDFCDIEAGDSQDCNDNSVPDECNDDGLGCVPDQEPPVVDIEVETPVVLPGEELVFRVTAQDNIAVLAIHGALNNRGVGLDGDGRGREVFNEPGIVEITADAVDFSGNQGFARAEARVLDPADADAPIIELDPLPFLIGVPTAFSGQIIDVGLVRWEATYGPEGNPEANLLGGGPRFGEPFVFGVLDPAQMGAGRFELRVEAEDINARISTATLVVDLGPCVANPEVCDGGDNDCDGRVDEEFVIAGQPCTVGLGACEAVGIERCYPGMLGTFCDAYAGEPSLERCDDFDRDCDGQLTNGFPVEAPCTVGRGVCTNTGRTICDDEGLSVTCSVRPSAPDEEICDGLDNDCNGEVDNGFRTVTCGVGRCEHTVSECDADQVGNDILECDPLEGQEVERCNDIDDDCDGTVDEAVCDDNVPPVVSIEVTADVLAPGEPVTIIVDARDDQQVAAVTLSVNGADVALDADGRAEFVFAVAGFAVLTATVRDAAGNETAAERRIRVIDPDDLDAPAVLVGSPAEGTLVEEAIGVTVRITDDNLTRWSVAYRPRRGEGEPVVLASGDSNVVNERVAFLDPGLIAGGLYVLSVVAEDINGRGIVVERNFAIGICRARVEACDGIDNDCDGTPDEGACPDRNPPEVSITIDPPTVDPGEPVTVRIEAVDDVGVADVTATYAGEPLDLDFNLQAVVVPDAPGAYRVSAMARDLEGNEGVTEDGVRVRDPDDVLPPTVVVTSPEDGAQLSAAVPIIGTVDDARFFRYAVSVSSDGQVFTPLTEGFDPVIGAEIAQLDLDLIVAGALIVRIEAEDWNGLQTVVEVRYQVGPAHCANGAFLVPLPNCRPQPVPDTGNPYADCVARINQFRMDCQCLPPLERWVDGEECADEHAEYDADRGRPHAGFRDQICGDGGRAQNECSGWVNEDQVISTCLQMMWDEGPGPWGDEHGHYLNMTNADFGRVACGFYRTPEGQVWSVQNFAP